MTAGRGIVHSERTESEWRQEGARPLFGIQSWVALPASAEESEPEFFHHGRQSLPEIDGEGIRARIIAGSLYGQTSPVKTASDMFYADAVLEPNASLPLPAEHEERAVYVAEGAVTITGDTFEAGQLLVFHPGDEIAITTDRGARLLLFGGEPMDGPRHIWWNFVSSSKERIEQAKEDWRAGRFVSVPGDAEEFIPLPE